MPRRHLRHVSHVRMFVALGAIMILSITAHATTTSSYILDWARQYGSPERDWGNSVTIDPFGNLYLCGVTEGNLDGLSNAGGIDVFLSKFDQAGNKLWTRLIGTPGQDSAYSVVADAVGNVYLTGTTNGDLNGKANAGSFDAFLIKYDPAGNELWSELIGTEYYEGSIDTVIDAHGNIYITGATSGDLDGNINAKTDYYYLTQDIFLTKYSPSGVKLWTKQYGSGGEDRSKAMAIDPSGFIYLTGDTNWHLDGNTSAGFYDAFLTQFDLNGNRIWTRQIGTEDNETSVAVTVDAFGDVFISGYHEDFYISENNGSFPDYHAFLTKYDSDGNELSTTQFGSENRVLVSDILTDTIGNVYATGYIKVDHNGTSGSVNNEIYLAEFNPMGQMSWSNQFGTSDSEVGKSIVMDQLGNIYITGILKAVSGQSTNTDDLDVLLIKLRPIPEPASLTLLGLGGLGLIVHRN